MRVQVVAAAEQLVEGAARWEDAYRSWERAGEVRERVTADMGRKLLVATGGLSAARFEAVCRRRSVRSVTEAQQKASAIRAKPAFEVALAERDCVLAAADGDVQAAQVVLAEASKVILGYGNAGPRLVGHSHAEVRRLARLPARISNE